MIISTPRLPRQGIAIAVYSKSIVLTILTTVIST